MKALAWFTPLALLTGCAAATPPPDEPPARPVEATCHAEAGQRFVGAKATAETGARLLAATGARTLRWGPPRTAMTMDFRADRLTVSYDDDFVIQRVSCT